MKVNQKKIKNLSREQKIQIYEAAKEKQRRLRENRKAFTPHEKQLAVITDDHNKRILVSGNGFGKTALGANEVIWALDGYNPVTKQYTPAPAEIVVVLDAPEKVGDVWLPELRKWRNIENEQLHKRGKPYYTEITWPNGSSLRFMFHLQEPMAFESLESDFVVLDEPPPRNVWIALLRSGRKKGRKARFLLIGTPIAQVWLREYYAEWEKGLFPDTQFFRGSTKDNQENLAEGYIEEFSMHLTANEKKTRLEGEFFNTEGLALAHLFDRKRHLEATHIEARTMPCVLAVDPHPNKPTAACLLGVDAAGIYHYLAEFNQKMVPRQFAQWLKKEWLSKYNIVDMVCDSSGNADYTGGEGFKSFIEVLNSEGVRIRGTTYDEKKDEEFLERIQDALFIAEGKEPRLKIASYCLGVIKDIENCAWQPIKNSETYKPKLEISNRDFLACLKYALAVNLSFDQRNRQVRHTYTKRSAFMGKKSNLGIIERSWRNSLDDSDGEDW